MADGDAAAYEKAADIGRICECSAGSSLRYARLHCGVGQGGRRAECVQQWARGVFVTWVKALEIFAGLFRFAGRSGRSGRVWRYGSSYRRFAII